MPHKSTARQKRRAGKDAIAVLKADHQRVRRLLDQLEKTQDSATNRREGSAASSRARKSPSKRPWTVEGT